MPFQAPSWTEFYTCPICENEFSTNQRLPISLGCGHTICRVCLATVYSRQCPFDQTSISTDVDNLPINNALLQLLNSGDGDDEDDDDDNDGNGNERINNSSSSNTTTSSNNNNNNNNIKTMFGAANSDNDLAACDQQHQQQQQMPPSVRNLKPEDFKCYKSSKKCIEELAQYLKSFVTNSGSNLLTRPMLRKLVTLVNCQLMEEEGRIRAVRTSRFLGERTVTELLLQHQNPQQLSLCLWAAVRSRGCQFLGPSMQEEVLKLVLQALENGSALSRKVLVMYVVQRLIDNFLPASKTSIGHVVQLLYRASCFKVSKRDGDSSLMQLKEEFRDYEALRREHDAQIVQIATEAGLRIAPDQWSSLLYGNTSHKSHMQSICDTLQTPSSFAQSVQELVLALQRTGDPTNLSNLRPHLKHLASIDPSLESAAPSWQDVERALDAVRHVVLGLVKFMQFHSNRKVQDYPVPPVNANGKYKISLCRDLTERRMCPRGTNCTFAHSAEERQRYRAKHRRTGGPLEKSITRPPSMVGGAAAPSGSQTLEKEYATNQNQHQLQQQQQQQNDEFAATHHLHNQQHQNQTLSHLQHTSPSDMQLNSPIKVKTSPMRKYNNNNDNGNMMRSNFLVGDGSFAGGISNATSPLHMQLHASPIPPPGGHMLNINAPTPILNVPPLHHQQHHHQPHHSYESIPFGSLNYGGGGGKFVRMPNMAMTLPPPPSHMRSTRGIMNNIGGGVGGGGGGGLSPRSSLHNSLNITTVVNPPNLPGTNTSNKPPASPLHKNIYNNSNITGDFYNTGPPYFANSNLERKPQIPSNATPMWDAQQQQQQQQQHQQQQHQQCQSINPSDFSTNHQNLMFLPPPTQPQQSNQQQHQHQPPSEPNVFFDKNSMDFNKPPPQIQQQTISNLDDSTLDSFMFKTTPPPPPGHHHHHHPHHQHHHNHNPSIKDQNKKGTRISLMPQDKSNMFWHSNANSMHNNVNFNSNTASTATMVNNNNNNASVNIEPSSSSSLFRDRESFVRSDSILDDDAATFDVPPTSTAALGSKYGPICPIYKGLTLSSTSPNHHTTNSFVDSWNALIHQENENQQQDTDTNNHEDFRSVFSLDNDMPQTSDLNVPAAIAAAAAAASSTQPSTAFDNYNSMQAALSKLSLNFINDSRNEQHQHQLNHYNFDLDPLDHILNSNKFPTEIGKNSAINDDLLWNNSGVNSNSSKQSTMNLGLDSFWSDNHTTTSPATTSQTSLINNNVPLTQQQQQQHHPNMSQTLDDTELDITEIVDKIWPCGDDSGIKLD